MLAFLHCLMFFSSKLHSTSINAFFDGHISNTTTVTLFSKIVLRISKNFAPQDKPAYQLLRNTPCKSEFVSIKRHTVNRVLCKSFLSRDPIFVVSPVDVVNINVKFTLLCSRVHVVKSHVSRLRVSVLKAPTIFTVNTVYNVVSRVNPTHRLCEAPQYIHTVVANNPANTSYSRHERILQPGFMFSSTRYRFYLLLFNFIFSYPFV